MATRNFGLTTNAERYYVLDEAYNNMLSLEEIAEIIESSVSSYMDKNKYYSSGVDINRERDGEADLFKMHRSITFNGVEAIIEATVFIEFGYYEGMRLDFDFNVGTETVLYPCNGSLASYYDEEYFAEDLKNAFFFNNMPYKLAAYRYSGFIDKVDSEVSKMKDDVNVALSRITESYRLVGTFSNGEAIYEKA